MSQVDWQTRYETGDTPWDKGEPHPVLPSFLSIHSGLFTVDQEVLLPGCGYGHDAALIGKTAGRATALDISDYAIEKGKSRYSAENLRWQVGDFFSLPEEHASAYDIIWEHTCFCAIPIERRDDYVDAAARLLKPHGLLCGIFFLNPNVHLHEGPPFGVSRAELNERFSSKFELLWDLPPSHTYPEREGQETMMLWRLKR